ncbi:MAG: hypothetical protein IKZ37_08410 [Bacteroidaceae bacterium]|nr:hypothetical protein [Bacteroidaceae bacterium]
MSNKEHSTHCTIIASATHLLVDCLCVCSLYILAATRNYSDIISAILLYNIIAFCTQPFTGMIADKVAKKEHLLHTSVALLAIAVIMTDFCPAHPATPLTAAIVLGAGNSLFHVWGGKETAQTSNNDIVSLGIFVAPGAMGLSIGYLFHSQQLLYASLAAIMLLSAAYTYINKGCNNTDKQTARKEQPTEYSLYFTMAAIATISAIVVLRSFAGEKFSSAITKGNDIILLIGIISTAGKMAGGAIARYIGVKSTIALLLIATAACYPLRHTGTFTALTGIFIINCTMPITLYLANKVMKGREGLAFGILAAALMPGYIIAAL